jgi:catechol 2,3-dioxygenase-like lactoylglutathione lyase family enzyme
MRTLHPAYRITDLATSLAFYGAIGFEQVGRVDMGDGVTLTMLKFPADDVVTLELVHRPPEGMQAAARDSAFPSGTQASATGSDPSVVIRSRAAPSLTSIGAL